MNNSDVKRQLRKPVYDESNSSFKFDEEDEMTVDKGINVDPSTFEHKKRILHDLAAIGQLVNVGHKFSLVTIKGKGEGSSKIQARFYTKHSASINVSVSRYSNGACYFGLRGSPVKILSNMY